MSVVGSNNILLGNGAALPSPRGSNLIVLGTDKSSLLIQGSLNYHVGETITCQAASEIIPIFSPLAQFYLINSTVGAFSIRMPSVQSSKGAMVTFRRTGTSTSEVTFVATGSEPIYSDHSLSTGPVSFAANKNQTQFICDGTSWYQLVN